MKTGYAMLILAAIAVAITVAVVRNPGLAASVQPQPAVTTSYICNGGKTLIASYFQGPDKPAPSPEAPPVPGGSVTLTLSDGRTVSLAHTVSADGGRYANADESLVFWDKGNSAVVLEHNKEGAYAGCIALAPQTAALPAAYANSSAGFSMRFPALAASSSSSMSGYGSDETYQYQALGPTKNISGVKFTIPGSLAAGSNLSKDSYLSVEELPNKEQCTAALFLEQGAVGHEVQEGAMTYSVASSSDAAAGNRYEEVVYAIPGSNPCMAVRYFIHYAAFENFPDGAVKKFDRGALIAGFDAIRKTLMIAR